MGTFTQCTESSTSLSTMIPTWKKMKTTQLKTTKRMFQIDGSSALTFPKYLDKSN